MDLAAHTHAFLANQFGPDFAEHTYLLAVSGGRDSMVLLEVFRRLLPAEKLVVAHFNHRARATADRDEELVESRCLEVGLEYARAERSDDTGLSEDELRRARRIFLDRARAVNGALAIVTAHQADDQLETFLMRVLRGAGLDGLGLMRGWQSPWLKPWLDVPRNVIDATATAWGVRYHDDETNLDGRYLRGRVRSRLAPLLNELAEEFGGVEGFYRRFAGSVAEWQWAADTLREQTRSLSESAFVLTPFWWRARRSELLSLSKPWRERVWRELAARAGVPVPDRDGLARFDEAFVAGKRAAEIPGLRLRLSCGEIFLETVAQRRLRERVAGFERRGETWTNAELGWEVSVPSKLGPAEVRFFRPGDRFENEKLKTRFLELRIPQPERPLLPVVARPASSEVLWFPGVKKSGVNVDGPAFALSTPTLTAFAKA